MLFKVPPARSLPGVPGIVTNPDFVGCLYFVLMMAAPGSNPIPTILFNQPDKIANLHEATIVASTGTVNSR